MPKGYLYAIRMLIPSYDFMPVKIGYSKHPPRRLKEFTLSPFPLEMWGVWPAKAGISDETLVHRQFAHLRLLGEWFKPEPELTIFVQTNIDEYHSLIKKAATENEELIGGHPNATEFCEGDAYSHFQRQYPAESRFAPACSRCGHMSDAEMERVSQLVMGKDEGKAAKGYRRLSAYSL